LLLNFNKDDSLSSIGVIDWEFVVIGPSFMDVGNFVAELFFMGFFTSVDSTYAEVIESFMQAYRDFGGPLDVKKTIAHIGTCIIDLLHWQMKKSSRETPAREMKCVDHALKFIIGSDSLDLESGENDPFASLSSILRDGHGAKV
jgi:hypothetical protein